MSLEGKYDSNNIFSLIIKEDAPAYTFYDDDCVMAFLDVFPQSYGHVLVIPKQVQARNILEVDTDTLSKIIVVVQRLSKVLSEELKPDGIQIVQFNGGAAGQTVYHLHFHIIPRWAGEGVSAHGKNSADPAELKSLQKRLLARL
ncbi:HIT family protein [Pseudomonas syringae]|uniref:HIT family protein n=1 Tax=Pseudomonas syringae TaxID=317 RepID=UPI0018E5AD29|nr:HIT family protein [Pseudomonas syringae]MBI6743396.1 HIT family protein [Pseudomonas syringae]MBI6747332.1 HIT family protein [Pseudomonas syringae]MBI6763707.1 HIT family protein [Pseudomonas syringae]MBI6766277.1 HIT family protein [Pseudomonas syringae]MBI6789044.1 HIT family protein [Pseudomonas syringae]